MSAENIGQTGPAVVSTLALVLSLANLYLQRRDRKPRLKIRARYEYRIRRAERSAGSGVPPGIYDQSQEGLYLLLGDFLREYELEYPQGFPVIRFALSNAGDRVIYLESLRIVFRAGRGPFGRKLVLDPAEGRVLPWDLARGAANVLGAGEGKRAPVELIPGDRVGYRFELIRLANTLDREGHAGNVRLTLEAADRLGNVYRHPFLVNTDLWAYPQSE